MGLRRQPLLTCCGMILLACGLCILGWAIYTWPSQGMASLSLPELLVEPETFPPTWKLKRDRPWEPIPERAVIEDYRAAEGVIRVLEQKECHCSARHRILRYRNWIQARKAFLLDLPMAFPGRSLWFVPEGWSYRSSVANQFRFACSHIEYINVTSCSAMAQYDAIISVLRIDLGCGMTLKDIEHILEAVDRQVAQHFRER